MTGHWLDQYANGYHAWQETKDAGRPVFYRPLGLVESAFDTDGRFYEGRADLNYCLHVNVQSHVSADQLRRRIVLAWTALRLHQTLLMARAIHRREYMAGHHERSTTFFAIEPPTSLEQAVEEATKAVAFLGEDVRDLDKFCLHARNAARTINPETALAKLFVAPFQTDRGSKSQVQFLLTLGHEIGDGLSYSTLIKHFLLFLNSSLSSLHGTISAHLQPDSWKDRLPVPQKDLYPRIAGSISRRRWFWVLTIVLRHVRKPLPAAFENPLRFDPPRKERMPLTPEYSSILDYSKRPPVSSGMAKAHLSARATKRLHKLCHEANASVGAGGFVLTAMAMMSLYETHSPSIPLTSRRPFIGGFPINPRPFFHHTQEPNSMMLAFSDGIVLPFLPSSLAFPSRFRLLARLAQRQLGVYQKRVRAVSTNTSPAAAMGARGPGRILASSYLLALQRRRELLPPHLRHTLPDSDPQAQFPLRPNGSAQTCGVSSVGRSVLHVGMMAEVLGAEAHAGLAHRGGDDGFAAEYAGSWAVVRARPGEFLVGAYGTERGFVAVVSFDADAMDPGRVKEWEARMEGLLLEEGGESARL